MKRNSLLISLIFLLAACSGGSGSSSGSDTSIQPVTSGPNDPADNGDDPTDVDYSDPADDLSYDFGGEYEGACVVTAMGINSRSCDAAMNIYHEKGGDTLGFMGMLNVDMGVAQASYPVSSSPLNIVDGSLVDPDTGNDLGSVGPDGFIVIQTNGDFMRFDVNASGGFDYEGEYTDPTYGRVLVRGSLEQVEPL